MVPEEIQSIKQWSHSHNLEEIKRPAHSHYKPGGALTYHEAVKVAQQNNYLFGFYVTPEDQYVLGDIDQIENPEDPWGEIPMELTMLLRMFPTYAEASPSGNGIRFLYKIPSKKDIPGSYFLLRQEIAEQNGVKAKGYQINISRPWMTITGNRLSWSNKEIAEVPVSELDNVFRIKKKEKQTTQAVAASDLPSLSSILGALRQLPLDQNPRVRRAFEQCFIEEYSHYNYWMKVLMGVHNYATLSARDVECLNAVLEWSRQDEVSYTSDEDVIYHWESLANKENDVTYKTVFKLYNDCILRWPKPKKQTKEEVERNTPRRPLITEYVNFKTLVTHYNINIYRDTGNPNVLYLIGDDDIIEKYFLVYNVQSWYDKYYGPFTRDSLTPAFYVLAQDMGFIGISHSQVSQFVKTLLIETLNTVDIIRIYFDTSFEQLPARYQENAHNYHNSTVDNLYEALEIEYQTDDIEAEDDMYKTYYRIWLMGFVRYIYFNDNKAKNNCILLLSGPEQIRKSSHFEYLLPSFFRDRIAFTPHGFSNESGIRDITKIAANNLVLVWDEIENYLTAETESNLKKVIDNTPQKIIDKYEVIDQVITPRTIYGGTSNLREFKLGNEGSRRLFFIPVKWVDTDFMDTICWHALVKNLKEEMEFVLKTGEIPWLLTKDQLDYQLQLHANIRAKNTLDYALEEIFDFSKPLNLRNGGTLSGIRSIQSDKTGRLLSTRDISDRLLRCGFGNLSIKRPALIKTLERLCGDYTGTRKYKVELSQPRCTIHHGEARQGKHRRWVVPPMQKTISSLIMDGFDQVNKEAL